MISDAPPGHRATPAFLVAIFAATMAILEVSKVNVALPAIDESIGATPAAQQLIVAGYALSFGLTLIPGGRLGDVYSRRGVLTAGILVLLVGSAIAMIAPVAAVLVVARVVQGIGAGLILPQTAGLMQQLYDGPDRARAYAIFGGVVGVASAFGPTLGGVLIVTGDPEWSWRLLFVINIPALAVLAVAARRCVPGAQKRRPRSGLDLVGTGLLGAVTVALMLPFTLTAGELGDGPGKWLLLLAAALLAVAFMRWERGYKARGGIPLLDLGLARHGVFIRSLVIGAVYFGAVPANALILALFLQQGAGLDALAAGLITLGGSIAAAVSAFLSGRLVQAYGSGLILMGIVIVIVGVLSGGVAALTLPQAAIPSALFITQTVVGFGGGLVVAPNQAIAVAGVPATSGSMAGSLYQVGQRIGTAIGVSAVSAVFFGSLASSGVPAFAGFQTAQWHATLLIVAILLVAVGVAVGGLLPSAGWRRRFGRGEERFGS